VNKDIDLLILKMAFTIHVNYEKRSKSARIALSVFITL
jgi:hypothetical protein